MPNTPPKSSSKSQPNNGSQPHNNATLRFDAASLPELSLKYGAVKHPPFDRHVHLKYHLGIVFEGVQKFWHKGAHHQLHGKAIATINPDEVHDGHSVMPEGYTAGIMEFSERTLQTLFADKQSRFFANSTLLNAEHAKQMSALFQHNVSDDAQSPEQTALLTERIQLLLGDIFDPLNQSRAEKTKLKAFKPSAQCLAIKQHLKTQALCQPDNALPLRHLAPEFDLSEYQLIRRFKKAFGITPYAYQLCLRLESAKAQLSTGAPIIDVAFQHGFSDQSHFTRCFKRAFFITPVQYLKTIR